MEDISRQPAEDMRAFNADAVKKAIEANRPDLCQGKAVDKDHDMKEFADHIASLMIRELDPARLNELLEGIKVRLVRHFEVKFKEAEKQRDYFGSILEQFSNPVNQR